MKKLGISIWTAVIALFFCQFSFAQEAFHVSGSRVVMVQPVGFSKAEKFSGFQNAELQSSIMVTEMAAPYPQMVAGFDEAHLASRGMKLISKTSSPVGTLKGELIEISQAVQGIDYHKWILAFGDQGLTVLITATFPEKNADKLSELLKTALLSTKYDASLPSPLQQTDMNFSVSPVAGLKLAARVQNSLVFNESGALPKTKLSGTPTVFVAAQALSNLAIDDRAAFARNRLRQTKDISNLQIVSEKDVKIGGLPGREILATGDGKDGEKAFIFQIMLYGSGSYFIMQGHCDASLQGTKIFVFREIANTFKVK